MTEIKATEGSEKKSLNFIEQIVERRERLERRKERRQNTDTFSA